MLEDLIDEQTLAELRGTSTRTLQRERAIGIGAPYIKLGRRIFYRKESLQKWLEGKEKTPTRPR